MKSVGKAQAFGCVAGGRDADVRGTQRLVLLGTLFVAMVGAHSTAWAGCGQYVHVRDEAAPATPRHQPDSNPQPRPPCHGPGCSANDPLPAIPVAPETSTVQDRWVDFGPTEGSACNRSGWQVLAEDLALNAGEPLSIRRPPR